MSQTTWSCQNCGSKQPMTLQELKDHLKVAHNITEIKGTQQAMSFLDGAGGWFQQIYEVKIGDVTLTKAVEGKHRGI